MRTQMQQEAFPDEDISDRPLPEESVPGLMALLEGQKPSGRYRAHEVAEFNGMRPNPKGLSSRTKYKFFRIGLPGERLCKANADL